MRRDRVRLTVLGVLRVVGRYTMRGLIGMQSTWLVGMPEADEAIAGRCPDLVPFPAEQSAFRQFQPRRRGPRLSAAERRAWADLEQRLR